MVFAMNGVIIIATIDGILTLSAPDGVVPVTAMESIIALTAMNLIITTRGTEDNLDDLKSALGIRWTLSHDGVANSEADDANILNTVIYDTKGTQDTSDDEIAMVLEDYTDSLTFADFNVVAGRVTRFIDGSGGRDRITGKSYDDYIDGRYGNDTIYGGGGNDYIFGNADNDFLYGDNGHDIIKSGRGNDSLYGNNGDDDLSGGEGVDFLFGGRGNDNLVGENGNDYLYGSADNDILDGGAGTDRLEGGVGDDIFVINRNYGEGDLDIITDFGFGKDQIRIDTQNGDEDTIAELLASGNNIRMEKTHDVPEGHYSYSDDSNALNIV